MRPIIDAIKTHEAFGGEYILNRESGPFFFVFETDIFEGGYFVTSSKKREKDPRDYTIHKINWINGAIDIIGSMHDRKSLKESIDQINIFNRVKIGEALILFKSAFFLDIFDQYDYYYQGVRCSDSLKNIKHYISERTLNYQGILILDGGFYFLPIPYKGNSKEG